MTIKKYFGKVIDQRWIAAAACMPKYRSSDLYSTLWMSCAADRTLRFVGRIIFLNRLQLPQPNHKRLPQQAMSVFCIQSILDKPGVGHNTTQAHLKGHRDINWIPRWSIRLLLPYSLILYPQCWILLMFREININYPQSWPTNIQIPVIWYLIQIGISNLFVLIYPQQI